MLLAFIIIPLSCGHRLIAHKTVLCIKQLLSCMVMILYFCAIMSKLSHQSCVMLGQMFGWLKVWIIRPFPPPNAPPFFLFAWKFHSFWIFHHYIQQLLDIPCQLKQLLDFPIHLKQHIDFLSLMWPATLPLPFSFKFCDGWYSLSKLINSSPFCTLIACWMKERICTAFVLALFTF